jgi:hypothetical protein
VKDIIVRLGDDDHPPVTGLVARYRRRDFFLSRWRITELNDHGVPAQLGHSRPASVRPPRR